MTIRDPELFGGLLHNLGQRRIVGVADERAQMMGDVMVETAREPAHERVTGRIICCCCEDVIYPIVKFAAV